jgi:hypothetical protein
MPGEASKREGIAGVDVRAARIYLGGQIQGAWMGAREGWRPSCRRPWMSATWRVAVKAARVARVAGAGRATDGCHSSRATYSHITGNNTGDLASIRQAARVCQALIPFQCFEVQPRPPCSAGPSARSGCDAVRVACGSGGRPAVPGQGGGIGLPARARDQIGGLFH